MKEKIYTAFAERDDITFILKDTLNENGDPISTEVVGWYFGDPNEESTRFFIGQTKAEYDF